MIAPLASPLLLSRLDEILSALPSLRVGVLGDFTLDAYWYADMARAQLSRETPLHARPVVRETYSCGAAANVAWNLTALGVGAAQAITVLGEDWRGNLLRDLLRQAGVAIDSVLTFPGWSTPLFGKIILAAPHAQQEDARLDFINPRPLENAAQAALVQAVESLLPGLDALIIADYHPTGIVTPLVIDALNRLAQQRPQVVFVADSRERIGQLRHMVLKPNRLEAAAWLFPERDPAALTLEDLSAAAGQKAGSDLPVFITLGDQGCLLCQGGQAQSILAVRVPPPVDPVGAGDAFLAALAVGLAAGATASEAGWLATLAAAVTVRKRGVTGTASPDEIRALAKAEGQ